MSVYLHTILALVTVYLAYLWGRYMTHGQIAAEVAEKTINTVSYTHLTLPTNREV